MPIDGQGLDHKRRARHIGDDRASTEREKSRVAACLRPQGVHEVFIERKPRHAANKFDRSVSLHGLQIHFNDALALEVVTIGWQARKHEHDGGTHEHIAHAVDEELHRLVVHARNVVPREHEETVLRETPNDGRKRRTQGARTIVTRLRSNHTCPREHRIALVVREPESPKRRVEGLGRSGLAVRRKTQKRTEHRDNRACR